MSPPRRLPSSRAAMAAAVKTLACPITSIRTLESIAVVTFLALPQSRSALRAASPDFQGARSLAIPWKRAKKLSSEAFETMNSDSLPNRTVSLAPGRKARAFRILIGTVI